MENLIVYYIGVIKKNSNVEPFGQILRIFWILYLMSFFIQVYSGNVHWRGSDCKTFQNSICYFIFSHARIMEISILSGISNLANFFGTDNINLVYYFSKVLMLFLSFPLSFYSVQTITDSTAFFPILTMCRSCPAWGIHLNLINFTMRTLISTIIFAILLY